MDPSTADLLNDLNEGFGGVSDEAKFSLINCGPSIIAPLLEVLPTLNRLGQLHATEILRELRAVQAGPALLPLLRSDHETVRDWAAQALGELGVVEAIPELKRAYRSTREREIPLDYSEPLSLRWALTKLGGRAEVLPAVAAKHMTTASSGLPLWPTKWLPAVLDDLADNDQAGLFVQLWRPWNGTVIWQPMGIDWTSDIDFSQPWGEVIGQTREWSELLSGSLPLDEELLASIVWVDQSDL